MDIEYKRLYLKYKKKYLELKQSGGSFSEEQQTALDKILNYLAGGLDYKALEEKLMKDDLYKQIKKELDDKPLTSGQAQDRINKMSQFKDKTGLSYEAANAYLKALQYKKKWDREGGAGIHSTSKSYREKFKKETTDEIFENGLNFNSILEELKQKKGRR